MASKMSQIDAYRSSPSGGAEAAIFYSINSTQAGLAGVSLGNRLIKAVKSELKGEMKGLETFSTLSPIPRLRRWALDAALRLKPGDVFPTLESSAAFGGDVRKLMEALEAGEWQTDSALFSSVTPPLERLAAIHLATEKGSRGSPICGVAKFHMSNGATMRRVNVGADMKRKGIARR